ncbi:MAG: WYL domain-containing protein [Aquihabitans sp.]
MTAAKVERLLTLMNVLLGSPRAMSSAEIQTAVAAYPRESASFKRQFERDKEELREMGVPLLMESVPGVEIPVLGYRVRQQDYELRDPGLLPDELEALNLAAAIIGSAGGLGRRGLLKLGAAVVDAEQQAEIPADPDLVAAFTGVAERRSVRFRYHDVDRTVDPYRLEFARGRWYLKGLDHGHGQERWYRMTRIQGRVDLEGDPGAFDRPTTTESLQLHPWLVGGDSPEVIAEVWFDPAVAAGIRADVSTADVVRDDEEGLVIAMKVTNREGFRSWLLSFLDRAEVLSPPDLRAEIVGWLNNVVTTMEPTS